MQNQICVDWSTFQSTIDNRGKKCSRAENEISPNGPMLMKNLFGKLHAYLNFYHFHVACHILFLSRPRTNKQTNTYIHTSTFRSGRTCYEMTKINVSSGLMVLVVVQWRGLNVYLMRAENFTTVPVRDDHIAIAIEMNLK